MNLRVDYRKSITECRAVRTRERLDESLDGIQVRNAKSPMTARTGAEHYVTATRSLGDIQGDLDSRPLFQPVGHRTEGHLQALLNFTFRSVSRANTAIFQNENYVALLRLFIKHVIAS